MEKKERRKDMPISVLREAREAERKLKVLKNWVRCDIPKETAGRFKEYLRDNHITYEPSENGNDIHFECLMDAQEHAKANLFLMKRC